MFFRKLITGIVSIIRKIFITILFWGLIFIGCLLGFLVIIPGWLMGASKAWCRRMIEILIAGFSINIMHGIGIWNVKFIDRREQKDKGPYVIVANHLSTIDTAFMALLPFDTKFTWNKKWSYVPIFGWLCLLAEHIAIDLSSIESKKEALIKSEETLKEGYSIIFYAEGTRGKNPALLQRFKTGAFRVAKAAQKNIVPITLIGTFDACARGVCDTANIRIIIDEPIITKDSDCDLLIQHSKKIIHENINKYKNLLRNKGTEIF